MASDDPRWLDIRVAFSPAARQLEQVSLRMPAGSTLADALHASGLLERHGLCCDGEFADGLSAGMGAKCRPLDTLLRDQDRVEIYRPLLVDPKEARRLRYRKARR